MINSRSNWPFSKISTLTFRIFYFFNAFVIITNFWNYRYTSTIKSIYFIPNEIYVLNRLLNGDEQWPLRFFKNFPGLKYTITFWFYVHRTCAANTAVVVSKTTYLSVDPSTCHWACFLITREYVKKYNPAGGSISKRWANVEQKLR